MFVMLLISFAVDLDAIWLFDWMNVFWDEWSHVSVTDVQIGKIKFELNFIDFENLLDLLDDKNYCESYSSANKGT